MRLWSVLPLLALMPVPAAGQASGDELDKAVPALIKALKDSDDRVRSSAASALCDLDKRALPALLDLFKHRDKELRAQAARIIGSMGTHGRRHVEALPGLTRLLEDQDPEVRRWAAYAISQITPRALKKKGPRE